MPDLVSPIPPGYIKFVKRIELISDVEVAELFPDIPFPRHVVVKARPAGSSSDKEEESPPTEKKIPQAFGVYIEYDHPIHGLSRSLWVIYDAGTGDYPFRSFLAPSSVAEAVGKRFEQSPEAPRGSMLAVIGIAPDVKTREKKPVERQAEPTQQ